MQISRQHSPTPLQVTILSDLPDSLQPKTILLEKTPRPVTVFVPKTKGNSYSTFNHNGEVTRIMFSLPVPVLPPVLRDGSGEVFKDKSGNPFILGDGGISNFTTYTTDNGLALIALIVEKVRQKIRETLICILQKWLYRPDTISDNKYLNEMGFEVVI